MNKSTRPWILPVTIIIISLIIKAFILTTEFPNGPSWDFRNDKLDKAKEYAKAFRYFESIYFPMYTRASGYAFGMLVGFLHYTKGQS